MDWNLLEKNGWGFMQANPKTAAIIAAVLGGIAGWVLSALHILPRLW